MSNWSDEQARQVGKAIKALRGDRTGQWLADRTAELGHPISRTTISELEGDTGRRKHVTTAELAVLAAALNVPPIALLYPGPDYAEIIEVLPDIHRSKIEAVQWFSGIRDHGLLEPAPPAEEARLRGAYRESIRVLELWRKLFAKIDEMGKLFIPIGASDDLREAIGRRAANLSVEANNLRAELGLDPFDGG